MSRKTNKNAAVPGVLQVAAQTYGGNNVNRKGLKILPDSQLGKFLILLFIATDAIFMYQITNVWCSYSVVMTVFTAIILATALDVLPSVISGMLGERKKKAIHYAIISVSMLILLGLFGVVFAARYYSADQLYQTAEHSLKIVSVFDTVTPGTSKTEMGQLMMTILFGIVPVATSVISFAIGFWENRAPDDSVMTKKLQSLLLRASLIDVEGNITELEAQKERDLRQYDEENRKLAQDDVTQYGKIIREGAKLDMALKAMDVTVLNHRLRGGAV